MSFAIDQLRFSLDWISSSFRFADGRLESRSDLYLAFHNVSDEEIQRLNVKLVRYPWCYAGPFIFNAPLRFINLTPLSNEDLAKGTVFNAKFEAVPPAGKNRVYIATAAWDEGHHYWVFPLAVEGLTSSGRSFAKDDYYEPSVLANGIGRAMPHVPLRFNPRSPNLFSFSPPY